MLVPRLLHPTPLRLGTSLIIYGIIGIMSCSSCYSSVDKFGATPANIQWSVVRGDTAKLRVQFFQEDELTEYDTDNWTYISNVYNPITQTYDTLDIFEGAGYVDIIAQPSVTENWGDGYQNQIAELVFDLQVTIPAVLPETIDTVWTPVIGSISVLADTTIAFGS